jgi:hypothetical protein
MYGLKPRLRQDSHYREQKFAHISLPDLSAACPEWPAPSPAVTICRGAVCGALLKKLKFNSKVLIDLATCLPNVKQWITIFCNFA